jgi:hypothetical protein
MELFTEMGYLEIFRGSTLDSINRDVVASWQREKEIEVFRSLGGWNVVFKLRRCDACFCSTLR